MLSSQRKNIIVIGASAGGVEAIKKLTSQLPKDFGAAIFIVHHLPPYSKTALHEIINRNNGMNAVVAEDEQVFEAGTIYCAPPNRHMLIEEDRIVLSTGPKENRFRPSVDALFRSAAYTYRERVIGIVLSGLMNDGTSGMCTISRMKGITMTQSLNEAMFSSMPMSVHNYIEVDYNLAAENLGKELNSIVEEKLTIVEKNPLTEAYRKQLRMEIEIAKGSNALEMGVFENGHFTPLTCPDCEGALIRIPDENVIRFRCHTGHAFTADALLAGITENIENDLYKAMRRMEEGIFVLNKIRGQMKKVNVVGDADRFDYYGEILRKQSREVHEMIREANVLSRGKLNGERDGLNLDKKKN